MPTISSGVLPKQWRSRLVILVLFLLLLYIVIPRFHSFSESTSVLRQADLFDVAIGGGLILLSYIIAAAIYVVLSLRGLRYWPTLQVQLATAFANRLLPAGIGGMGLYVEYLRHSKHTLGQAAALAATNNLLGAVTHALLVVIILSMSDNVLNRLHLPGITTDKALVAAIIGVAAVLLALLLGRIRRSLARSAKQFARYIFTYRAHPDRLAVAMVLSVGLTLCHVVALYCCAHAVGLAVTPPIVFMTFTLGIAAGTATPTPGGLGGVEAGLLAGFVGFGNDVATALAAVLLYRLVSYWLLLLPGFVVLVTVRRRYLV